MIKPASIEVVTGPAIEPVNLSDVRAHLRIDDTDSDSILYALVQAARDDVESRTHRAMIERTLDVKYDCFGNTMELPQGPLQSVTSVKYLDTAGDEQTLDSSIYRVLTKGDAPGTVELAYSQSWPSLYGVSSPVTIRIVAGFGTTRASVPMPLRQAMLLLIEKLYDQDTKTSDQLDEAVKSLIAPWVVHYF